MTELDDAVPLAAEARRGDDTVDAGGYDAVGQPLEHHSGVDDHLACGRHGIDPIVADLDLQTRGSRARQGGDQVDVAVRTGPDMTAARRLGHRWVANGSSERGPISGHLVEERLVTADCLGDDPQEPSLDVFDAIVEGDQQPLGAGYRRLGEHLAAVPVRVALAQRMSLRKLPAPVEHLFPIGYVARRRGLHEQAGIPRLTMAFRGDEALFDLLRQREELGEHAVRSVEEVLGQVVTGVHEPGRQTAAHAVDNRGALRRGAPFVR